MCWWKTIWNCYCRSNSASHSKSPSWTLLQVSESLVVRLNCNRIFENSFRTCLVQLSVDVDTSAWNVCACTTDTMIEGGGDSSGVFGKSSTLVAPRYSERHFDFAHAMFIRILTWTWNPNLKHCLWWASLGWKSGKELPLNTNTP